jgi:hypothetical protein
MAMRDRAIPADQLRQNTLERVVFRGEAARWRDAPRAFRFGIKLFASAVPP